MREIEKNCNVLLYRKLLINQEKRALTGPDRWVILLADDDRFSQSVDRSHIRMIWFAHTMRKRYQCFIAEETEQMQDILTNALRKSRCTDFIRSRAEEAWQQIRDGEPRTTSLMSEEAKKYLADIYFLRMGTVCFPVLKAEIRDAVGQLDPVGVLRGKPKEAAVLHAADAFYDTVSGNVASYLTEKYPLLNEYFLRTHRNYTNSFITFFRALAERQQEISECFFLGRQIRKILHLSASGADVHRNGQCVIGAETDAGAVFYKPHDCGLDSLYHEMIQAWFSDCTRAAKVIEGDEYAFVSCLESAPVNSTEEVAAYFKNFGMLAALFHGLGSTDMHQENIIACGPHPACADVETLLSPASGVFIGDALDHTRYDQFLAYSLIRTAILPVREYLGPLTSPLYTTSEAAFPCLPEWEGKLVSVQGHEDDFILGFREGYSRMLAHRDEILNMINRKRKSTLRCLLKNTRYYAIIQDMLYQPEYLKDKTARERVFKKLLIPYKNLARDSDMNIVRYEWACLLKGDIPYFCTEIDSRDLCGESTRMIINRDYYSSSSQDITARFLSRLSEEEMLFELRLIRFFFAHAPVDEEEDRKPYTIQEEAIPDTGLLYSEIQEIFLHLQDDMLREANGSFFWLSTAVFSRAMDGCGNLASLGDAGLLCARLIQSRLPGTEKTKYFEMANDICKEIGKELNQWNNAGGEADKLYAVTSVGLYTGLGGLLCACGKMISSGISGANELYQRILHLILKYKLYLYPKTTAAEGTAGLILGLSSVPQSPETDMCMRLCAEKLLSESKIANAGFSGGWAGIAAALCAAYGRLNESLYLERAVDLFEKVRKAFDPKLAGWRDDSIKPVWMAGKEPYEAGIYIAATVAEEAICADKEAQSEEHCHLSATLREIKQMALTSMMKEDRLIRLDTLDQGNALTLLALIKAGEIKKAVSVFSAMLRREKNKGEYTTMPQGVRSTFDASFWIGTCGLGYALVELYDAVCRSDE